MEKKELALEILKLCAQNIITQELQQKRGNGEYAKCMANAYNEIYNGLTSLDK